MEMKLLAYCPHCKKIFPSTFAGNVSPGSGVIGCRELCPECGEMAQTSDYINNTMRIADHAFHTTSDTETLKNLLQILQDGQKQNQDLDRIADKIQALSHKFDNLAEFIRQGKKKNKVEMVWAVIKYLIPLLLPIINQLIRNHGK